MRLAISFLPFTSVISNCGMLEFSCLDNKLFWRRNHKDGTVCCRLDQVLANE